MSWHEEYLKKYKEAKEKGVPFFPDVVLLDAVTAVVVFAALVYLAYAHPPVMESLADPTDSSYNPRPEWYFLFLFQALKLFPGSLEAVAAILMPGAIVGTLFLVPFLDRHAKRHPLDRPFWTGLGVVSLGIFSYLTWAGFKSPMTNPTAEKDPKVAAGKRLFAQLDCAYCHSIKGKGGKVGPALDTLSEKGTDDWIARHLRDPQGVSPGTRMPKLSLLDDEVAALTAYIRSYNPNEPYTPAAPKLFVENCSACHKLGGQGADLGPDLSEVGAMRDKAYINSYIADPSKFNAESTMPAFKEQLKDTEIEDIARYLARQRRR